MKISTTAGLRSWNETLADHSEAVRYEAASGTAALDSFEAANTWRMHAIRLPTKPVQCSATTAHPNFVGTEAVLGAPQIDVKNLVPPGNASSSPPSPPACMHRTGCNTGSRAVYSPQSVFRCLRVLIISIHCRNQVGETLNGTPALPLVQCVCVPACPTG